MSNKRSSARGPIKKKAILWGKKGARLPEQLNIEKSSLEGAHKENEISYSGEAGKEASDLRRFGQKKKGRTRTRVLSEKKRARKNGGGSQCQHSEIDYSEGKGQRVSNSTYFVKPMPSGGWGGDGR